MKVRRQPTAFHETFSLNRPAVSGILALSVRKRGQVDFDTIRQETALGANYADAMPRYARAVGLLEHNTFVATTFGTLVAQHDPHLDSPTTQWIMHYHLSAPHGPGPAFWHDLVVGCLRLGTEVTPVHLARRIALVHEQQTAKALAPRTARATASVFIGTYAKSDALGTLGIMKAEGTGNERKYRIVQPEGPPAWALAYALADYWSVKWEKSVTVALHQFLEPGGVPDLFWLGTSDFDARLAELQRMKVLDVYKVAPPFQVVRLWNTKDEILERAYG